MSPSIARRTIVLGNMAFGGQDGVSLALVAPGLESVNGSYQVVANQPFELVVSAVTLGGVVDAGFSGEVRLTLDGMTPVVVSLTNGTGKTTISLSKSGNNQVLSGVVINGPGISGTVLFQVHPTTGTVDKLLVSAADSIQSGVSFSVTVTAQDKFGNVVTGFNSPFFVSSSDPFACLPINCTLANGISVITATLYSAGSQSINATTSGGNTPPTGKAFLNVKSTHIQIIAPSQVNLGTPYKVTVRVVDDNGTPIIDYLGSIIFSTSDVGANIPYLYVFSIGDGGVYEFDVTLSTIGIQTIGIKDIASGNKISGSIAIDVKMEIDVVELPKTGLLFDMDWRDGKGIVVGNTFDCSEPLVLINDGIGWIRKEMPLVQSGFCYGGYAVSLSGNNSGFMSYYVSLNQFGAITTKQLFYSFSDSNVQAILLDEGRAPGEIRSIKMISNQLGWASVISTSNMANMLYKYSNGQWALFQETPYGPIQHIRFLENNPNEGWATSGLKLIKYSNGVWEMDLSNPDVVNIAGLWMNSYSDVWACKTYGLELLPDGSNYFYRGQLFHFGGSSWEKVSLPQVQMPLPTRYKEVFEDITFYNSGCGITVGYSSYSDVSTQRLRPLAYLYKNGEWKAMSMAMPMGIVDMDLQCVRMISQNEAWIIANVRNDIWEQYRSVILHVYIEDNMQDPTIVADNIIELKNIDKINR